MCDAIEIRNTVVLHENPHLDTLISSYTYGVSEYVIIYIFFYNFSNKCRSYYDGKIKNYYSIRAVQIKLEQLII